MELDVIKRLLELSKSGLEGLEYVKEQIELGKYEQSMIVLTDVIHAFSEIEQVLEDMTHLIGDNEELIAATNLLRDGFDWMVGAYEKQNRMQEIMEYTLLARYKAWQEKLEKSLNKLTVS